MKLCVRNLSNDFTDDEVKKLFGEFGKVESASILIDRHTGMSNGIAFVRMNSTEAGEDAIAGLHGFKVHGCDLDVSEFKDLHAPAYKSKEQIRSYSAKVLRGSW